MLPFRDLFLRLPLRELSLLASLVGASAVMVWRVQEGRTAVTTKKILIPPIGMATGFCMFLVPDFRFPLLWALYAFLLGAIVLAAIRILAHSYLDKFVDVKQTAALFFVLAFGMIVHWRLRMYFEYRRLTSG